MHEPPTLLPRLAPRGSPGFTMAGTITALAAAATVAAFCAPMLADRLRLRMEGAGATVRQIESSFRSTVDRLRTAAGPWAVREEPEPADTPEGAEIGTTMEVRPPDMPWAPQAAAPGGWAGEVPAPRAPDWRPRWEPRRWPPPRRRFR